MYIRIIKKLMKMDKVEQNWPNGFGQPPSSKNGHNGPNLPCHKRERKSLSLRYFLKIKQIF